MKLTILRENLKNSLNIVEKIITKSLTLPILNNVLLEASKNFLVFSTTNLETGINYWSLAKIEKEGKITVPVKIFSNFVSSVSEEVLTLEEKNKILHIKGKQIKAQIKGQPPEEFPIIPKIETKNVIEIENPSFCEGLSQVVDFTATSQIRPELTGVYFSFQKDKIIMVATDSFRLAEKIVFYKTPSNIGEEFSFILPQKTVKELLSIFGEIEGGIKIYFSSNQVLFEYFSQEISHPQIQLISRLIEGEYPAYQEVIPQKYETRVVLNRNEFLNQLKVASLFSGKTNNVKLIIEKKKQGLEIFSENPDFGEQKSYLYGKIEGKETEVSFNYRFLIEGISNIKSKDLILELNGEEGPALVKPIGDESYLYVVMPIKPA